MSHVGMGKLYYAYFFVLVEEQAEIIKKLLAQTADFDKKKAEWNITIQGLFNDIQR